MPMYWTGPWKCYCSCGWESEWKKNPVAAQFAGEAHIPHCPSYRDAVLILNGEKRFEMSNRDKYFQSSQFLKAADIKKGQIVVVEKFEEAKTRLGLRPILRLKGIEMPLGLNATNYDRMVELHGEDEEKWAGKKLTLTIVNAPNPQKGGKEGPAIRIA